VNRPTRHWSSLHRLCPECPPLRKQLHEALTGVLWVLFVGAAAATLWHWPTISAKGEEWARLYGVCVDSQPPAASLGDGVRARLDCARWASEVSQR